MIHQLLPGGHPRQRLPKHLRTEGWRSENVRESLTSIRHIHPPPGGRSCHRARLQAGEPTAPTQGPCPAQSALSGARTGDGRGIDPSDQYRGRCCLQACGFTVRSVPSAARLPVFLVLCPRETFSSSCVSASKGPAGPGVCSAASPALRAPIVSAFTRKPCRHTARRPRNRPPCVNSAHLRARDRRTENAFWKSCDVNHSRFLCGFCLCENCGFLLHMSGWNSRPHSEKPPSRFRACAPCWTLAISGTTVGFLCLTEEEAAARGLCLLSRPPQALPRSREARWALPTPAAGATAVQAQREGLRGLLQSSSGEEAREIRESERYNRV